MTTKKILGGLVELTTVTLSVCGDDLVPDEVSRLLGHAPSFAAKKGEARSTPSGRQRITQPTGVWLLKSSKADSAPLEAKIGALFDSVTHDMAAWKYVASRYTAALSCGAYFEAENREVLLSPSVLARLAERGMGLALDIYCFHSTANDATAP